MKPSHKRALRRDRRNARASGWRRQGKIKMGIVGHGPNGGTTHNLATKGYARGHVYYAEKSRSLMTYHPFADLLKFLGSERGISS